MEKQQLQELLFQTAFFCVTCDGHIDDRELQEIKAMGANKTLFSDLDIEKEIEKLLVRFNEGKQHVYAQYFNTIESLSVDYTSGLLILEVCLRIMHADKRIDDNEKLFLKLLKDAVNVPTPLVEQRFGRRLDNMGYDDSANTRTHLDDFLHNMSENSALSNLQSDDFKELFAKDAS